MCKAQAIKGGTSLNRCLFYRKDGVALKGKQVGEITEMIYLSSKIFTLAHSFFVGVDSMNTWMMV